MDGFLGHLRGGIAGLLRVIDEHGGALEYDLMTRCGATLDDVPARIPWTALRSFVTHLDASSALVKEQDPDIAGWQGTDRVPMLLADAIDAINVFRWQFECANTPKKKRRPKRPEPYPRPGVGKGDDGQKVGRDPIPVSEFDEWWSGETHPKGTEKGKKKKKKNTERKG